MNTQDWSVQEQNWICEGLRDYVGLWQIVRFVGDELGPAEPAVLQEAVLEEVGHLLAAGVFEAVDLEEGGGSVPWLGDTEPILDRLREEWNRRGAPPNIPDMPWLRLTETGRRLAARIEAERD